MTSITNLIIECFYIIINLFENYGNEGEVSCPIPGGLLPPASAKSENCEQTEEKKQREEMRAT